MHSEIAVPLVTSVPTRHLSIQFLLILQVAFVRDLIVTSEEWVDASERTTLTCAVDDNIARLIWAKTSLVAGSSANSPEILSWVNGITTPGPTINASRFAFAAGDDFSITINAVEVGDEGKYWCEVIYESNLLMEESSSSLRIRVPPSTIALRYNGTSYTDGSSFTVVAGTDRPFTCITPSVKPAVNFTWTLAGGITSSQPQGSQTNTPNSGDNRLTDSSSTIIADIRESPSTSQLMCGATNRQDGLTDSEIDITVTLQVRVPPREVKLSDDEGEKVPGATVAVDQGTSHTFTCLAQGTRPAPTIQWFLNNNMPSTGIRAPTSTENNELFDTSGTWLFAPLRNHHRQQVKCEAYTAESVPPYPSAMLTVDVNGPPDVSVISGSPSMTENIETTLTCTADMGYPADWILAWLNGGSPVSGSSTNSSASGSRYSFTSTLTFIPRRQDNGNIITCTAQRGSWTPAPQQTLGPINVQFCSKSVSVSCPSKSASGSIVQLSCHSDSSNPATALVWSKNNVVQENPTQSVIEDGNYGGRKTTLWLTTGALTKADNGAVYKCSASCTNNLSDSCALNVEYPPDFSVPTAMPPGPVEEGNRVTLLCSADANPKPAGFITWERVGSLDSLPSVYNDGTSNLTLSSIRKEQAGSYRCRGNNGVPPVVHSSSVDVIVHYEVRILTKTNTSVGAKIGRDATLICKAKGHPLPRMTWQGPAGAQITNQTDPGRIFQADTVTDGDDVYGFTITSILYISQVTATTDYGSYICNSGNGVGMVDTVNIVLNDKVKPLPPEDVTVDQATVTGSAVMIAWKPGNDGGETQWFFLNYRDVETTRVFDPNTRVRIDDDIFEYMIDGLSPYTLYEIEVFARNQNGDGESVTQIFRTRPNTPENLGITATLNQDTGSISVDGIPQDGDALSCLQLEARLADQNVWFNYGDCLDTNTHLATLDIQSSYCYGNFCSLPVTALLVAGQSSNAGLIAGLVILTIIILISITVNVLAIRNIRRNKKGSQEVAGSRKLDLKSKYKPKEKRAAINEAVEYQDLDVPLQVLAISGSSHPGTSAYASISETATAFSRDKLTIVRELGQGAFGKVLLGKASGIVQLGTATQVAIKTLRDDADLTERGDLLRELDFMKQLPSHAYVVKLLGFCADGDPIYIIMEYMSKGPLKDLLTSSRGKSKQVYSNLHGRSKSLTSRDLIKFAKDVAEGMAFLASQQCIHRDLAARNVLVGENMVCKVSDFGLARDIKSRRMYQRQSEGRLPIRWMALESIVDDVYTTEGDVWSYGILLWEIVTLGARPYPTMSAKTMIAKLQEGYRMPRPDHCQDEIYQMMLTCWKEDPTTRPSFTDISQKLEKALEAPHDYITLSDYQESDYEVTIQGSPDEKI
ncbi:nephrin-like isoform X2 [Acanthaster planci]|uniref:receptor protein-tyrosine kinase n=1 Tax=Acanthaster planci TaxID=133434 RepID=A0A8B7ZT46_ACAPL|nr:nephrin-like isoform X2 [Acanthaster planci]